MDSIKDPAATSPCRKCLSFLLDQNQDQGSSSSAAADDSCSSSASEATCPICLGLWQNDQNFKKRLEESIQDACQLYGSQNRFSSKKDPPLVSLPGDILFRYELASTLVPQYAHAKPSHVFLQQMKYHVNNLLASCIQSLESKQETKEEFLPGKEECYPKCVSEEEQGYLAVHILLTPVVPRPPADYLPGLEKKKRNRKKQFETQGGHPRDNLERKLQKEGVSLWPVSHAVEMSDGLKKKKESVKASNHTWFFLPDKDTESIQPIPVNVEQAVQIRVALWRRPFLVQGHYTKARRDVSQTPFFIHADNPKKRQRLGVTSIEEQILPPLTDICGGISNCNNNPDHDNVIYGKAKFHASGREDMDVRMILPPQARHHDNGNGNTKTKISGRPFCCEVIDSLRMPSPKDLEQMVHAINHTDPAKETPDSDNNALLLPPSKQYYGRNPLGVGVDPVTFSFAPAEAFKNLQSETEEKHKHYGCLCWSQETLPPSEELEKLLTTTCDGTTLFPLELKQQTPIRVLHRRANAVRIRHIVSCPLLERLDDHYFRLHISTDAGTYVKEFCHGDLGRTQPSVSTLLGCKTDILELDCEGIQIH